VPKIGLNVGSGQRPFTSTPQVEWINVDKIQRDGHRVDLIADGAHLPYEPASVDYFVLHHVLEHFGCGEADTLIKEAHRVLRDSGSLLVFVPNIRALAREWLSAKLDTQIFLTNVYGAYMGSEEDRHKWAYDPHTLGTFLRAHATWSSVLEFDWRSIDGSDVARDWWICAMEARK